MNSDDMHFNDRAHHSERVSFSYTYRLAEYLEKNNNRKKVELIYRVLSAMLK